MKKLYAAAALFISACSVVTVLSACNKNEIDVSTTSAAPETSAEFFTKDNGVAYSQGADGYKYAVTTAPEEFSNKNNVTGHSYTYTHPSYIEKTTKQTSKTTVKASVAEKEITVKNNISKETVKNESKGISVLYKSDAVPKGSTASITIMGEAGKIYSISFYKNATTVSSDAMLCDKTADANGLAVWTFEIENDCEAGNRKVIIKEKGSDNFVQTSINVK